MLYYDIVYNMISYNINLYRPYISTYYRIYYIMKYRSVYPIGTKAYCDI